MLFEHGKCRVVCTNPKCIAHMKNLGNLVKNGRQRNGEQRYKCKICRKTCNIWSSTPASGIRCKQRFLHVAKAFSRGCTIADIADMHGLRKDTVVSWLLKIGNQMDEIKTWVGSKSDGHWIWQAIEVCSKLWLASHVSRTRDQNSCNLFVGKTAKTLTRDSVMLVTTDGMIQYENAVKRCFKSATYAQVVKRYEGRRLVEVQKRVPTGEPLDYVEELVKRLSGGETVNTAFTERLNATIRRIVGRLARKTLAFSRSPKCLEASIYVAQVAYNFVMQHRSLSKTPAQAAGLCTDQLSWLDIILHRCRF
jgi:transposase-like protein